MTTETKTAKEKGVTYKCFNCGKPIDNNDLKKRFVCPHCGSKIFFKPRTQVKTVKAI